MTPANLVTVSSAVAEEYDWLNAVVNALNKGNLAKDERVSQSAYHVSIQTTQIASAAINAKQIQWAWPAIRGQDQFVIMFGVLHIEMAVLKVSHVYVTLYQINLGLSTV